VPECTSVLIAGQHRRCSIRATLRNGTDTPFIVDRAGFRLQGLGVPAEAPSVAAPDELPRTELAPGQEASGLVTFDLPVGRRYDQLTWFGHGAIAARRPLAEIFAVGAPKLSATSFSVTVDAAAAETTDPSPALSRARDAAVASLRASLPAAWTAATRGLGRLTVVERDAGIPIKVHATGGTSVHRSGGALIGQEIAIYVAEPDGRVISPGEILSTGLHELGHIWCCFGAGTADAHWDKVQDDGRTLGLNRYGLMNSPIRCNVQPDGSRICPDRFSDRELGALGFTDPPPLPPDPCVAEADELGARVAQLDRSLDIVKSTLDDVRAELALRQRELAAYDRYRASGVPPALYAQYQTTFTRYRETADREAAAVAAFNQIVRERNGVLERYRPLAARCLSPGGS